MIIKWEENEGEERRAKRNSKVRARVRAARFWVLGAERIKNGWWTGKEKNVVVMVEEE